MLVQSLRVILQEHKSARLLIVRVRGKEKQLTLAPQVLHDMFLDELDDVKFMLLSVIN